MCKKSSNFAPDKKSAHLMNTKKFILFAIFSACCLCVHAETLILRTGARVVGTIVFQNEEVVIIRDESGARFQYPRTDIQEVLTENVAAEEVKVEDTEDEIKTSKKASILIELGGGGAYIPNTPMGGAASANLLVGSHHLGNRHIFVGGGIGYNGLFIKNQMYHFLPIQVALRLPLLEQKHAPLFGMSLGYGVALAKTYVGGLYAGLDFGYRCQVNRKTAVGLVLYTQFQQAKVTTVETIEGIEYENKVGRNLLSFGAKFALYF